MQGKASLTKQTQQDCGQETIVMQLIWAQYYSRVVFFVLSCAFSPQLCFLDKVVFFLLSCVFRLSCFFFFSCVFQTQLSFLPQGCVFQTKLGFFSLVVFLSWRFRHVFNFFRGRCTPYEQENLSIFFACGTACLCVTPMKYRFTCQVFAISFSRDV